MKINRCFGIRFTSLIVLVFMLGSYTSSPTKSGKYACSEANPAQLCNDGNTCGSASAPCTVDVKRTTNAASVTANVPNAKSNAVFCLKVGTSVTWKSTGRDTGFVVDVGPSSPFDPSGTIIGGSDRSISVVAKRPGCYRYSAGACVSGAIYGMCGSADAEVVITGN